MIPKLSHQIDHSLRQHRLIGPGVRDVKLLQSLPKLIDGSFVSGLPSILGIISVGWWIGHLFIEQDSDGIRNRGHEDTRANRSSDGRRAWLDFTASLARKLMSIDRTAVDAEHAGMRDLTILPPALGDALREIGSNLESGRKIERKIDDIVRLLHRLDPRHLPQAEGEIVTAAALHRWRREPSLILKLFMGKVSHADQLRAVKRLEYLFLFHRDGRLREAALRNIAGPLPNGFLFAAIAWRLNDWAKPVRQAAVECALRTFAATPPRVIAEAALVLLTRQATWGRWGSEKRILDASFERDDVTSCLADTLATRLIGPMASLLRQALRSHNMDKNLERLAVQAIQPAVRAAAIQSLISGHAEWPSGWRWRWIDKPMGIRRRETTFERRSVDIHADPARWIRIGLQDHAAAVRDTAMSGLIQNQAGIADARFLATSMLADRSAAVRERAEFVLKQAEDAAR